MKPRARLLLLVALATGLWWARERLAPGDDLAQPTARAARKARVAAPPADLCTTPAALPVRPSLAAVTARDPFTGQATQAAPAPQPRAVPVVVAEQPPPPPAPVAPPPPPPVARAPYQFLGLVHEKNGAASVFLTLAGALITARPGDTLDGGWRLDAIAARELTFTQLGTQKTVRMPIEGEPQ